MKLEYSYKTATIEEDATVVPRPNLPGCSSFPYSGTEGVLPNADTAATSEVAARYYNRVEDCTSHLLRRGETASSSFVRWSTGRRKHRRVVGALDA
jgi:hypothetical protein